MQIAIYLDTNIFNYLQRESKYHDFYKKILGTKGNHFYYYSFAHILDLKRDPTEHKFEDLNFMESIVDNFYLIHYYGKEYIEIHNERPINAFNNAIEESDNQCINLDSLLMQFEDGDDDDENSKLLNSTIRQLFKYLKALPALDLSTINLDIIPSEHRELIDKLIPKGKTKITLGEIINQTSLLYEEIYNSKDTYKKLRRYLVSNLNLDKDNITFNNENFNEDFQKTFFQKTFKEYVFDTLDPEREKDITWESFIIQAYTLLNMLGIDKEPNKKARFPNTFNDAQHCYYASSCHYIVSEDEGFLRKCKLIYQLVDFKSVVLTLDEFMQKFDSLEKEAESIFR